MILKDQMEKIKKADQEEEERNLQKRTKEGQEIKDNEKLKKGKKIKYQEKSEINKKTSAELTNKPPDNTNTIINLEIEASTGQCLTKTSNKTIEEEHNKVNNLHVHSFLICKRRLYKKNSY